MVKCVDCKHQHSSVTKEPCRSCIVTDDKPGFELRPPDVITNEEKIKSLTTEQLALFLSQLVDCSVCKHELLIECKVPCEEQWIKWLKREV